MLEAQLEYSLEAHKRGLGTLTREVLVTIGSGPNMFSHVVCEMRWLSKVMIVHFVHPFEGIWGTFKGT